MSDFIDDETTRVPADARGMRLLSVELVHAREKGHADVVKILEDAK